MYAKVVVVGLWYGFCEEIYCIIAHLLTRVLPTSLTNGDYLQFLRTHTTNLWIYHAYQGNAGENVSMP